MFPYDPSQEPFSGPGNLGPWGQPLPQAGPLGGLQDQTGQVFQGAAPGGLRHKPQVESWAEGAAVGLTAWLIWRQMKRRKAAKGTYFSPGWWCLLLFMFPLAVAFGLSLYAPLQFWWFQLAGLIVGTILATVYAAYRITGHGRYNTRRRGSPRRDDRKVL